MALVDLTNLIETGAHFGHLTRRWNPKMKPYIFMEKNGIHIIDLKKTQKAIEKASNSITEVVSQGKKILFVGTKKQAKIVIAAEAKRCEMNWVSERWLGGMLTNFSTIRKSIKRLQNIDKMETDGTFEKITKKEILFLSRERDKLRKILDGVESMSKLPGAMFIVDIKKESIAIKEALRLNIPIYAIVDTNCNPDDVNYIIPANDDAVRSIELITRIIADSALEGLKKAKELRAEEVAEKEKIKKQKEETEEPAKDQKRRIRKVKFDTQGESKPDKRYEKSLKKTELKEGTDKNITETAEKKKSDEEKVEKKIENNEVKPEEKTDVKAEEKTEKLEN